MILKGRKTAYKRLVELTGKKLVTVKKYFHRKKWDVLDVEHQKKYLNKFMKTQELSE